jgi:uncharacterized protein (DUF2141 family)
MRTLILAGAFAALAASACAADVPECAGDGPTRLVVSVTGVRSPEGEMAVTVYPDDPNRFLAPGGKLLRQRVPTTAPVTRACFNLPRGAYAISVYHDANGNHDFDRSAMGMPIEGFGFSNNPQNLTALPDFQSVRTVLRKPDNALTIRLTYP